MRDLDLTAETIDIRDVIERYEALESNLTISAHEIMPGASEEFRAVFDECKNLESILSELKGCGGDEEWRGEWYPITLVSHDYFVDYAQELVEDCGYLPADLPSWIAIDWEKTADAVKEDYSLVTIGSNDYWYR